METVNVEEKKTYSVKDLNTENPRWCAGCGDFAIIAGVKKFMVEENILPENTVNVSGIGCSGRAPFYINTYGIHGIHGRAIPLATGIALVRPELNLFIHSGDGDALSIGGNHLIHGINKNINCTFILYDNAIYALTKSQTSPTTPKGHQTNTQPEGTFMDPLNPIRLALGIGASFVAGTADWMPDHFLSTIRAAHHHRGFSFVHVDQRCPHFYEENFDYKSSSWFSFLTHEKGVEADKRLKEKTEVLEHDPTDLVKAFDFACNERKYYGLYYINPNKPSYEQVIQEANRQTKPKPRSALLDRYLI
jgi:2-oxoglutarate ferredoxin oxidoreductase subunit beta